MTVKTYQVVVTGQLAPGAQLEQVKEKVARLYNAPAAKLVALFDGTRVVVKKGLDQAAAERYVAALLEAGLIALAESLDDTVARASPTTPTLAPVGVALVEPRHIPIPTINTSALSVAAVGSDLVEFTPPPTPKNDTSGLTTAPVGETLVEAPEVDPPAIDISRLTWPLPGERLVDAPEGHPPYIDTSHLDLAPAGCDVGAISR